MLKKNNIKQYYINKIKSGQIKKIKLNGSSMLPTFSHGEYLDISLDFEIKIGEVVVADKKDKDVLVVHRIVETDNTNKKVKLLGDNEEKEAGEWFNYCDIIAKISQNAKSKKSSKPDDINIIIDLPFNTPKHFNEKTFQIYQALIKENQNTFYYDFNLDFNIDIYGKNNVDKFKNISWQNRTEFNNIYNIFNLRREIKKQQYNLFRFTFTTLSICNNRDESEIKYTIENYRKTIYYNFFIKSLEKIKILHKIHIEKGKKINFYISVDNFDKLLSGVIFSKCLNEVFNKTPILIDNSTLFNGKFETDYYQIFFEKIIPSIELNKNINTIDTNYNIIDFDRYITKFKVCPINIRSECYYKRCLFCDRHNKDNFSFNIENISKKIKNLYKLGVKNIIFKDDCLIPQYIYKLLENLKLNDIDINWQGIFRFDPALDNEKIIKFFSENGCKYLFFGLETFSQNLLDKMHKGIKIENVINILNLCKKYKIKCGVSLLFAFPGETINDINTTFVNVKKYIDLIDNFEINFFTPTKNCKIDTFDCENRGTINYFCNPLELTSEKKYVVDKLLELLKNNNKFDSFYLKNYTCWSKDKNLS